MSSTGPTVLLDARSLQGPDARRGIGTYAQGLLGALAGAGFDAEVGLLLDARQPTPELPGGAFRLYEIRRRYGVRLGAWEDAVALNQDIARIGPRLFHALTLNLPGASPRPVVVTLHDLIPWAYPGPGYRGERIRYALSRRLLRRAAWVLAISRSTAADATRLAGVPARRVEVVYPGVEAGFAPQADAAAGARRRFHLEQPYFLYVGALDPRKQPGHLHRAWLAAQAAGAEADLVLAGEPGAHSGHVDIPGARRLGPVARGDLVGLLAGAACLLFPSRYEGFGLPALEALACGCPVVAYRNSSLPEVVGDAGILVPDGDWAALGSAAAAVALDRSRAGSLRRRALAQARRFSWPEAARRVIRAYRDLLP